MESIETNKIETFVPTHEFQEIKDGQGIPRGLHVRINLTTGKKEAKLLDDSRAEDDLKLVVKDGTVSVLPEATNNKG